MSSTHAISTLILAFALGLVACTGGNRVDAQAASAPPFDSLSLSQGPCFGTCPVYTLTVHPDGRAVYDGRQYTRFRGDHYGRVGGDTLARIRRQAELVLAQADTLPREIESGVTDVSQRRLRLYRDGEAFEFVGDVEFADPVAQLLTSLQAVGQRDNWTPAPGTPPAPPSELIVVLDSEEALDDLRGDFYRQLLRPTDTLSAEPPSYRLRFDPYAMTAEEMIRDLGNRDDVVEVGLAPQD